MALTVFSGPECLGQEIRRIDRHVLAGTTTVDGQPAGRLVVVFLRSNMTMLAARWSDPSTGAWTFSGMPEYPLRGLFVTGFDHTGQYNAEIADLISQVAREE